MFMINELKSKLALNFSNMFGWKTNHRIVVFESDDWGSIRMPNEKIFTDFLNKGYNIDSDPYCKYDTLANSVDLEALYEVLKKYSDKDGQNPIITFNTVVANPDFNKIKKSSYLDYYYEPFTETLSKYYPNEKVYDLWSQGINEKLIKPQFHGREHVNVPLWLEFLKNNNKVFLDAFENGFWGVPKKLYAKDNLNIQASYSSNNITHVKGYKETIKDGLNLFENIFGFRSKTFIANNYTWPLELNEELANCGVLGLQSMRFQKLPDTNKTKLKRIFTGDISKYSQIYTVRNCTFEPSQTAQSYDDVNTCLEQINNAFLWKKPAIISMHRLNLIGSLVEQNRKENLFKLNILIKKILELWPDVIFMSSDQLVELIKKNKFN